MPRVIVQHEPYNGIGQGSSNGSLLLGRTAPQALLIDIAWKDAAAKRRLSPEAQAVPTSLHTVASSLAMKDYHTSASALKPRVQVSPLRVSYAAETLHSEFSQVCGEFVRCLMASGKASTSHAAENRFASSAVPGVTVEAYVRRILQYTGNATGIVAALALLQRSQCALTPETVHRQLLGYFVLSVKMHDDSFHPFAYYAAMGGVTVSELKSLELEAFRLVDYNGHVSAEEFRAVVLRLRRLHPLLSGRAPLSDEDIPREVSWDALLPPMA